MSHRNRKLILLDLGGVLVELGEELFPAEWLPGNHPFRLAEWFQSNTAKEFELGRISSSQFIRSLSREFNSDVSLDKIKHRFETWPRGLYPGAANLLQRLSNGDLSSHYELAVLSNTNELHEKRLTEEFGLSSMVTNLFFSHRIGLAKPCASAFHYVLDHLGYDSTEVLFFDDNLENVTTARRLGLSAHQVFSPDEITRIL